MVYINIKLVYKASIIETEKWSSVWFRRVGERWRALSEEICLKIDTAISSSNHYQLHLNRLVVLFSYLNKSLHF